VAELILAVDQAALLMVEEWLVLLIVEEWLALVMVEEQLVLFVEGLLWLTLGRRHMLLPSLFAELGLFHGSMICLKIA